MYWQPPRKPRAGIAIGATILALWLGALGIAFATEGSGSESRGATPLQVWPGP
jgi:hypothetical protein